MVSHKKPVKVAVSGYFNPLHVGHLRMLKEAKKLGDILVVIVNSDAQVKLKGSVPFMNEKDRMEIIGALKPVDKVILSIDKDKTVCKTLAKIKPDIFANGGDRATTRDIPEDKICRKLGIKMVFGVGGKKINSSSRLLVKAAKKIK
jgi:D-beta-D-heptose 7-phosphate kinase/D-beta-D-heptose 1-phosphate adenosyltransferase